jgi:hypothetical protein
MVAKFFPPKEKNSLRGPVGGGAPPSGIRLLPPLCPCHGRRPSWRLGCAASMPGHGRLYRLPRQGAGPISGARAFRRNHKRPVHKQRHKQPIGSALMIIKPPKTRRWPDTFLQKIDGTHGPCALCGYYSKLTDDHIPPESVGNFDRWNARSYLAASTANKDLISGRRFHGGVRFRTLCADCNNGLGGKEDKTIAAFFAGVKKLVESRMCSRLR